ncbi:MAG: GAF domain-containing protein, partial [Syntrophomonadaceae bacterium]|nr:GAF domain-containing protein [Syntrophomonadaceae bacterium]
MRKLKEFIQTYVFSEQFPLDVRVLNMICMVGTVAAVISTISRIFMKNGFTMALVMAAIILLVLLTLFINIRFNFYRIIALGIPIILGNILFPAALFLLGGSYSGMSAYFVLSITVMVFLSTGTARIIILTTHVLWVIFCYFLTWRFYDWEIIPKIDPFSQMLDNIQSFIVAGLFVGLVVAFQKTIYKTEKRKVEDTMKRLETAQKTVTTILESNPHINVMFDSDFSLIDCNPAAVEYFGFASKEEMLSGFLRLLSESIPAFQPSGLPSVPLSQRLKTTTEEGAVSFRTELHLPGGVKIADVEMKRIFYGNSFAIVCYLVDLTVIHQTQNSLIHSGKLLNAVNDAALSLLTPSTNKFESALKEGMGLIARSVDVDRVYIWRNKMIDGTLYYEQIYEWLYSDTDEKTVRANMDSPYKIPYISSIPEWETRFLSRQNVSGVVRHLSPKEQEVLAPYGILSILVIPLFFNDLFWGFVSFDDCHREREFSEEDGNILRSGSLLFINAIMRNEYETEMKERFKRQDMLTNISQKFISNNDMHMLINDALRQIGETLAATRILIVTADTENGENYPYIWVSSEEWLSIPFRPGFIETVKTSFPAIMPANITVPAISCNDTRQDEKYQIFENAELKSFIWSPLYVESKFWGIISVEECASQRIWSEKDSQFVSIISNAVAGG